MTYQDRQRETIRAIEDAFKRGEVPSTIVESRKDYAKDNQIGLTSVSFVPKNIQNNTKNKLINPLCVQDDRQYFYLPQSLHLTVQNIRTINNPPLFSSEDIEKAKFVFENIIPKHRKIKFVLKDLFELPTSLAVCAYSDESYRDLVAELREELVFAGVPDNKKYASDVIVGNVTVCRYTTTPTDEFIKTVKELKNIEIGELSVDKVFLITTNAVCYPSKTTILGEYPLT